MNTFVALTRFFSDGSVPLNTGVTYQMLMDGAVTHEFDTPQAFFDALLEMSACQMRVATNKAVITRDGSGTESKAIEVNSFDDLLALLETVAGELYPEEIRLAEHSQILTAPEDLVDPLNVVSSNRASAEQPGGDALSETSSAVSTAGSTSELQSENDRLKAAIAYFSNSKKLELIADPANPQDLLHMRTLVEAIG